MHGETENRKLKTENPYRHDVMAINHIPPRHPQQGWVQLYEGTRIDGIEKVESGMLFYIGSLLSI